jgi:subtilisin family serine protease/subtilisin-like proprotein convertase family protein
VSTRKPRLWFEQLEERTMLDAMPIVPPSYADGYATSRILVQFKPEFINVVSSLSGTTMGQAHSLVPGLYEVELNPGVSVEQALEAYKADNRILFAQPDWQIQIARTPNDPSFGSLWGLHNTGQSGGTVDADIDAPEAWDVTTGSSTMIVGVIDTGIDFNHPDLAANMWRNPNETANGIDDDGNGFIDDIYGADFANNDGSPLDDNNHGTHVAGTIGAVGNNGVGVVGVNWNVRLMGLKFLSASGSGFTSDAIEAINYGVAKGAKILNNSWGGGGFDQALFNAIVAARNAGVIFVAAAGNSGANNDTGAFYPANYNSDNVVSVAATDRNDNLASFSNYGATNVDLAAPGVSILSTTRNNTYSTFSGTSMATPHVAGAMALVWGANPSLTYRQVIDRILQNVDPKASLTGKVATGGRLNVAKALGGSTPDTTGPRVTSSAWSGAGNSVNQVQFTFSENIAAGTFTTADVIAFTGPGGVDLLPQLTGVTGSGTVWTVTFNSQSTAGAYSMTIGPSILDTATPGNAMDQNQNGINGEVPGDRLTSTFTLSGNYTFASTDVPKSIFDLQTAISVITINQDLTIKDVNVTFYITHTWDSDLRIRLRAPDNTLLTLVNYRGGSGDNFGNATTPTTMDDEAGTAISSGSAPFVGSYRPELNNQLSKLDGKNARGTWRLEIYDRANLDTGTLRAWSLVIQANNGGAGGKKVRTTDVEASKNAVERGLYKEESSELMLATPVSDGVATDTPVSDRPAAASSDAINRIFAEVASPRRKRPAPSAELLGGLLEGEALPL